MERSQPADCPNGDEAESQKIWPRCRFDSLAFQRVLASCQRAQQRGRARRSADRGRGSYAKVVVREATGRCLGAGVGCGEIGRAKRRRPVSARPQARLPPMMSTRRPGQDSAPRASIFPQRNSRHQRAGFAPVTSPCACSGLRMKVEHHFAFRYLTNAYRAQQSQSKATNKTKAASTACP